MQINSDNQLAKMLLKAQTINKFNTILQKTSAHPLSQLSLVQIENNIATFIAKNQSILIACKLQQKDLLLNIQQLLPAIKQVKIELQKFTH